MNATTTGTLAPDLELQPCKSPQRPSPQCTAARHGNRPAYLDGCRCDTARRAYVRYQKQWNYDRSHGRPRRVPAIGARRRVQALACMGWSTADIGRELGRRGRLNLTRCDLISVDLHLRIAALFEQLSAKRGPSPTTARSAAARGWFPPLAWDDDTIDDPNRRPTIDVVYKEIHENKDGRRLVLTSSDIDSVVVERLTSSDAPVTPASHSERYAAYALLRHRGTTATAACEQLKVSSVARTVYAEQYARDNTLEETA